MNTIRFSKGDNMTSDFLKHFIKEMNLEQYEIDKKKLTSREAEVVFTLGHAFEKGILLSQSYEDAFYLYNLAASVNDRDSLNNLGWLYLNGYGVNKDICKAEELFLKAAKLGNSIAMVNIGNIYESGLGMIEVDYKKSYKWYRKAANCGNLTGIFNYANMMYYGYGVKRNRKKAFELFKILENFKYNSCYFYLGLYYQEGYVVEKNYNLALKYYKLGAAEKDCYCIHQLGVMYGKGLGVEQNMKKALRYYRKSALLGDKLSCTCIGWFYENGEGVKRNIKTALKWYDEAARSGEKNAIDAIMRLDFNIDDMVVAKDEDVALNLF